MQIDILLNWVFPQLPAAMEMTGHGQLSPFTPAPGSPRCRMLLRRLVAAGA